MPEILNRWHIGADQTLEELIEVFNSVMGKLERRQGPLSAGTSALYHFPEVFQRRKDEYIYAMIRKIVEEEPIPNEDG